MVKTPGEGFKHLLKKGPKNKIFKNSGGNPLHRDAAVFWVEWTSRYGNFYFWSQNFMKNVQKVIYPPLWKFVKSGEFLLREMWSMWVIVGYITT